MRRIAGVVGAVALLAACGEPQLSQAERDDLNARVQEMLARSNWKVTIEKSPVTDAEQVTMVKYTFWPEDEEYLAGDDKTSGPRLVIRCRDGELDLIVDPDEYLSTGEKPVLVRFDATEPREYQLMTSTTGDAVGWWGTLDSGSMISSFAQAKVVAIRVAPYGEVPKDMVFKMADLQKQLPALEKACGRTFELGAEPIPPTGQSTQPGQ